MMKRCIECEKWISLDELAYGHDCEVEYSLGDEGGEKLTNQSPYDDKYIDEIIQKIENNNDFGR